MKKYHQLFRIDVKHDYFTDGVLRGFAIEPTPYTQQLMRQYDLRLQNHAEGITIYCGLEEGASMTTSLSGLYNLCFLLKIQDPSFINYTDLPLLGQEGKKYYFSNNGLEQEAGLSTKRLQKAAFVSGQDGLPFHPLFYQHLLPKNTEKAQFTLKGLGQNAVDQDQVAEWNFIPEEKKPGETEPIKASVLQLGFTKSPWGKYELNISGEESLVFGVMPGDIMPSTFAMIEIMPQLENFDQYEISFQARKTSWRYYIINKNEIDTSTIRINKGSANQVNGDAEEVPLVQPIEQNNKELSNGDKATLLELTEVRALQERPTAFMHLSLIGSDSKEMKVNLPYANSHQITPEIVETEETDENGIVKSVKEISHVYSDIYVYL